MNRKGDIFLVIIIVVVFLSILWVLYSYPIIQTPYKQCLEEKAKNYCSSINQHYDKVVLFLSWEFYCRGNVRIIKLQRYDFLDSEREECKNAS